MKNALTIILVLVAGFFIGSYLNQKGINPVTQVRGAIHDMSTMSAKEMADSMTGGLATKTGNEFDKEFIKLMIIHHQGAVTMAQLANVASNHKEIKDMAKDIITVQSKEIDMMKNWQHAWFPEEMAH